MKRNLVGPEDLTPDGEWHKNITPFGDADSAGIPMRMTQAIIVLFVLVTMVGIVSFGGCTSYGHLSSASEVKVTKYGRGPKGAFTRIARVRDKGEVLRIVQLLGTTPYPYSSLSMVKYDLEFRSEAGKKLDIVVVLDPEWYLESNKDRGYAVDPDLIRYLDGLFAPGADNP